jgi:hypothetical protein
LLADLGLGRAGARQRRINVQRVGLDAVIDATWIVVENIRGSIRTVAVIPADRTTPSGT